MAEYLVQDTTMKAIADAIRSKGNTSAALTPAGMASAIGNISTGVETGDATATAADILSGKTAYAKGSKVTGTIATQGAKTVTPGKSAKTAVAAGMYTTGDVKVAGDANLKASNIKEGVSIFGVAGTLVDVEGVEYIEVTPTTASLTLEVTYTIDSRPSAAMVLLEEASTSTGVYGFYYMDATNTQGCMYGGSAGLNNYTTGVVCNINESAHTITFSSGSTSRKFFTKPYRVYIFRNG